MLSRPQPIYTATLYIYKHLVVRGVDNANLFNRTALVGGISLRPFYNYVREQTAGGGLREIVCLKNRTERTLSATVSDAFDRCCWGVCVWCECKSARPLRRQRRRTFYDQRLYGTRNATDLSDVCGWPVRSDDHQLKHGHNIVKHTYTRLI